MHTDTIESMLLELNLGYTYIMSDYCTSSAEERAAEEEGLAQVRKIAEEINSYIEDTVCENS